MWKQLKERLETNNIRELKNGYAQKNLNKLTYVISPTLSHCSKAKLRWCIMEKKVLHRYEFWEAWTWKLQKRGYQKNCTLMAIHTKSKSKLCYDWWSVTQSVLVSSLHLGTRTRFLLLSVVVCWCGAPSLIRSWVCHLQLMLALSSSHSWVWVPWDSWPYFTVSTSHEINDGSSGTGTCSSPSFYSFPLKIILPPLLQAHLSWSSQVCNSPDQAAHNHILGQ
jgi:hypothetical protein